MRRTIAILFSLAMMVAFVIPAAAEVRVSTPDASTPQASPEAVGLQEGETEYARGLNMLTIDLTALDTDEDGQERVDSFEPEGDTFPEQFTFEGEHEVADGCRMVEYSVEDLKPFTVIFVGICASDDFGLFVIGSNQEATEYVLDQFSEGETDLVPEGFVERD